MDVELLLELDHAGRRGRGRGARRRRRGRRAARSAAPPRARSGRARRSRPRRSARRGSRKPPWPSSSRASCWICSRSCERSTKTWATAKASSRVSEGLWPPARTSSAQILRGMSTSRPQPSPSPSTLPARWSIFCRARDRQRRSARGSASRPCGPRRRSRRRPCPRRSAERRAAGRRARASSGLAVAQGLGTAHLTSRFPRLLRAGARRVGTDGAQNYRWGATRDRSGADAGSESLLRNLRNRPRRPCRLLQRYFQPVERFYIVFSERSQSGTTSPKGAKAGDRWRKI